MTNDKQELELLAGLPNRLKELRNELAWSLDDVAQRTGVTQRGVASNWEATNQRRRTPPLTTLLVLQRWYGASLDYMVGLPGADRDSPAVKAGKLAARQRLQTLTGLDVTPPGERAVVALGIAMEAAPGAFFRERVEAFLFVDADEMTELMKGGIWPDSSLKRLSVLLGIQEDWFYSSEPARVLLDKR